jgi:hypothetical protein
MNAVERKYKEKRSTTDFSRIKRTAADLHR